MLIALLAVLTLGIVVVLATPKVVEYTESIVVDAPVANVYDHIRLQERLMRWSAWPVTTGSDCRCEGVDGTIGAQTVFLDKKGAKFGFQEVTALEPSRRVGFKLKSKGPEQQTWLDFELVPEGSAQTKVRLHFRNVISRPFNVILRAIGIVRWTRAMHRKDLAGLKAYAEPPHRTYAGEPAHELLAA